MLAELRVRQLGVIDDTTIVLEPGMTALTGETGAGKTLLVDAIGLLLGGPADSTAVRPGASEAVVEARFFPGDTAEVVLSRVVVAGGRSRAYIDGRMLAAAQLAEEGGRLVDVHGQHAHQSLLSASTQRRVLDDAMEIDTSEVLSARRRVRELREDQAALGGDPRARARELDLARFQLNELDDARLEDPLEDDSLEAEEEVLADASGLRTASDEALQALAGDDGVIDAVGQVVATLSGRRALSEARDRLLAVQQDLSESAAAIRSVSDAAEDDPARLADVTQRRHTLSQLRRKYGESLGDVIAFREELRDRVKDLESHDERAARLDAELAAAIEDLALAERKLWEARRAAAPVFAGRVQDRLADLGMSKARFEVQVGPEPGSDSVTWKLGPNLGEPVLPLSKVASGGELSRTMLAVRLAAGPAGENREDPATLVFDEVDAGIGGEAAVAVGRALADVARHHQVLVVTHLPQVAAFADHQIAVSKTVDGERTVAQVRQLSGDERVVELSRMLSGSPDSRTARRHAQELLARSSEGRPRH